MAELNRDHNIHVLDYNLGIGGQFGLSAQLHEPGNVSRALVVTDHEKLSFQEKVDTLEAQIQFMAVEYGLTELFKTGDESLIYPLAREEIARYRKGISQLHDEVSSPQAVSTLEKISIRYKNTAELPHKEFLETVRGKNKRIVTFDFDNTISDYGKYRPGVVDPLLVGSESLDPLIGDDREYLLPIMASIWQPVAAVSADIFAEGGAQVPLRDGMKELLEQLLKDGVQVNIISTNFAPFIESALKRIEGSDAISVFCIRDQDARATEKGDLLKKIQLDNPDAVMEFVGDGSSDFPSIQAVSIIPGFHAVSGQSFDKRLTESGVPHLTFENGFELAKNLGIDIQPSGLAA